MIEKWRHNLDQVGICGALFTDLSKAFDCLVHDVLIATHEALWFYLWLWFYSLTENIEQKQTLHIVHF